MSASSQIVDLRNLLAKRYPPAAASPSSRLRTGVPALDQAGGGGLPKSAITELTSLHLSSGSASVIHALLQNAFRDGYFLALIDGRDSFDPAAWSARNDSPLRNLLWLRCTKAVEAVKAADLLLRDGNFPLVILDLVLNYSDELRPIPQTSWYRLQRLVEATPIAFLVLTRHSMISSAQLKLSLENAWKLEDLEQSDLAARLKILVTRAHGGIQTIARAG